MRVGVWEADPELIPGSEQWQRLSAAIRRQQPEVFLLNELPFGSWLAAAEHPDNEAFLRSCELHDKGMQHLNELEVPWVLGTYPSYEEERRINQAYVWNAANGAVPVHTKQFFPDEEGYYEARWFTRGKTDFRLADLDGLKVGFLICTEVMFNEWARFYGRLGAHVIAVPRAVGRASLRRWRTALSMAAIVSGCYVVSSNRGGIDCNGQEFGGCGWVFNPFGDLVAETSPEAPVMTIDCDLDAVQEAQSAYPCYVAELSPVGMTNLRYLS